MKKISIYSAILVCAIVLLSSCNQKDAKNDFASSVSAQDAPAQEDIPETTESKPVAEDKPFTGVVDRDFTRMNSNMVYAEVFNMMIDPESYVGKYFKMKGKIKTFEDGALSSPSYAVIVSDALACCQQGIDFVYDFNGNPPPEDSEIVVVGKFVLAELNGGISYIYLDAITVDRA